MDKVYHFSAPSRTEIGGNHTDHQHGCVLAAAVDMKTTAEVRLNGTNVIRVDSEGYKPVEIDLSDLKIREEEKNTTAALIRGVAAAFASRGYQLAGFDAKVKSTLLPGSGLSSSAAKELSASTAAALPGQLSPLCRMTSSMASKLESKRFWVMVTAINSVLQNRIRGF